MEKKSRNKLVKLSDEFVISYDIMEDEVSVSPQQTLPPENEMANCEMADLEVEMCEKKQVRLIKHVCRLTLQL